MDVRALASLHAFPRVGFVIPKYKHSGVERNRLKRRLREIVRLGVLSELAPMDLVIRVLPVAYGRNFEALRDEVLQAVRRITR
jgi:ribonuclease P protein component